jgi:predicted MFS family arabinose efflux permease
MFFVYIPLGALAFFFARRHSGQPAATRLTHKLDVWGGLTVTTGFGALIYGLSQIGRTSQALLSLIAAPVFFLLFLLVENRARNPLIPLDFFKRLDLVWANLVTFLAAAATNTPIVFFTIYMQEIEQRSTLETAICFLPTNFAIVAGSLLSVRTVARAGVRLALLLALGLIAAAGLWFARLSDGDSYLSIWLPGLMTLGLGLGILSMVANLAATTNVVPERHGLAAGLVNTAVQVGTACGLATLVNLLELVRSTNLSTGAGQSAALVEGLRWAFYGGAVFALAGGAVTLCRWSSEGVGVSVQGSGFRNQGGRRR